MTRIVDFKNGLKAEFGQQPLEDVRGFLDETFRFNRPISVDRQAALVNCWINRQGFWDSYYATLGADSIANIKLSKHALIVTEVAELTEAVRHGNPASEHIPAFTAEEEELADIVIRVMDYAAQFDYRLEEAIAAKMLYNLGRPHKHGKQA